MMSVLFSKCKSLLETLYPAMLAVTCVYSYLYAPTYVCTLVKCDDPKTTAVKAMYPRSVAIACFASRVAAVCQKLRGASGRYERKIGAYETHFPEDAFKRTRRRLFAAAVALAYAAVILPMNVFRVYLVHRYMDDPIITAFTALMYVQNASICTTEVCFAARCFGLYQKFQSINEEMAELRSETIAVNRYPAVLHSGDRGSRAVDGGGGGGGRSFLKNAAALGRTADGVERFRMRHQFVRSMFGDLNDLYGFQVGLSLLLLYMLALLDIYGELLKPNYFKTRSKWFIYGWMLQYSFRFCVIIFTTYSTTKQAYKSKTLVSDINNRYLDNSTKEELRLFYNQIFSQVVDFNSCDFFTLNPHLITTAIATGTTYLVVLLQLN